MHYANAAIALQHKNEKEAKEWMAAAEKNFSPQLNKLFAESLIRSRLAAKTSGPSARRAGVDFGRGTAAQDEGVREIEIRTGAAGVSAARLDDRAQVGRRSRRGRSEPGRRS